MKHVVAMGTFDLLHPGHTYYLSEARKLGDRLTVVVSRNETAALVKGRPPIHSEPERVEGIRRLGIADDVILGRLDDRLQTILGLQPDVVALGYDQRAFTEQLEETLHERGLPAVRVVRIPAFKPDVYKSSILRRRLANDGES